MIRFRHSILIGALLWLSAIQYYIVQLVVATAWNSSNPSSNPYSWAYNTISDLANNVCGPYGQRLVCSPHHGLMNASFIILGTTMIGGSIVLARMPSRNRYTDVGYICMAIAGAGPILVGLFPENTIAGFHIAGAGLSFVLGNIALIILGSKLSGLPGIFRGMTVVAGLLGLTALVLFLNQVYIGLGIGGMERIVAYPQSLWMIAYGVYLLRGILLRRIRN